MKTIKYRILAISETDALLNLATDLGANIFISENQFDTKALHQFVQMLSKNEAILDPNFPLSEILLNLNSFLGLPITAKWKFLEEMHNALGKPYRKHAFEIAFLKHYQDQIEPCPFDDSVVAKDIETYLSTPIVDRYLPKQQKSALSVFAKQVAALEQERIDAATLKNEETDTNNYFSQCQTQMASEIHVDSKSGLIIDRNSTLRLHGNNKKACCDTLDLICSVSTPELYRELGNKSFEFFCYKRSGTPTMPEARIFVLVSKQTGNCAILPAYPSEHTLKAHRGHINDTLRTAELNMQDLTETLLRSDPNRDTATIETTEAPTTSEHPSTHTTRERHVTLDDYMEELFSSPAVLEAIQLAVTQVPCEEVAQNESLRDKYIRNALQKICQQLVNGSLRIDDRLSRPLPTLLNLDRSIDKKTFMELTTKTDTDPADMLVFKNTRRELSNFRTNLERHISHRLSEDIQPVLEDYRLAKQRLLIVHQLNTQFIRVPIFKLDDNNKLLVDPQIRDGLKDDSEVIRVARLLPMAIIDCINESQEKFPDLQPVRAASAFLNRLQGRFAEVVKKSPDLLNDWIETLEVQCKSIIHGSPSDTATAFIQTHAKILHLLTFIPNLNSLLLKSAKPFSLAHLMAAKKNSYPIKPDLDALNRNFDSLKQSNKIAPIIWLRFIAHVILDKDSDAAIKTRCREWLSKQLCDFLKAGYPFPSQLRLDLEKIFPETKCKKTGIADYITHLLERPMVERMKLYDSFGLMESSQGAATALRAVIDAECNRMGERSPNALVSEHGYEEMDTLVSRLLEYVESENTDPIKYLKFCIVSPLLLFIVPFSVNQNNNKTKQRLEANNCALLINLIEYINKTNTPDAFNATRQNMNIIFSLMLWTGLSNADPVWSNPSFLNLWETLTSEKNIESAWALPVLIGVTAWERDPICQSVPFNRFLLKVIKRWDPNTKTSSNDDGLHNTAFMMLIEHIISNNLTEHILRVLKKGASREEILKIKLALMYCISLRYMEGEKKTNEEYIHLRNLFFQLYMTMPKFNDEVYFSKFPEYTRSILTFIPNLINKVTGWSDEAAQQLYDMTSDLLSTISPNSPDFFKFISVGLLILTKSKQLLTPTESKQKDAIHNSNESKWKSFFQVLLPLVDKKLEEALAIEYSFKGFVIKFIKPLTEINILPIQTSYLEWPRFIINRVFQYAQRLENTEQITNPPSQEFLTYFAARSLFKHNLDP